jgi:RNA-directed DNA polymerase
MSEPLDSYRLRHFGLPKMNHLDDLSEEIKISKSKLNLLCFRTKKYYKIYNLPKKSGGFRTIAQPSRDLKAIQGWILRNILDKLSTSSHSKGFEIGSSTLQNAVPHVGANFVLNIDFENFFPSVNASKVYSVFNSIGYNKEMCVLLTNLCTYNSGLPQGAPTSPKLANLACAQLDARIHGYAGPRGIIYTRYADDITLSAQTADKIFKAKTFLSYVVPNEGLTINEKKTEISGTRRRKTVTGLVVSENRVGVGREKRRKLRSNIHKLFKEEKDNFSYVNGMLGYCFSVDKISYKKLHLFIRKMKSKYPGSNANLELHSEKHIK